MICSARSHYDLSISINVLKKGVADDGGGGAQLDTSKPSFRLDPLADRGFFSSGPAGLESCTLIGKK